MISAEQALTLLFIACAAVCWTNVRALLRDKCTKGCSLFPTYIFLATNLYEVWYFHHIHQPLATFGSLAMAVVNLTWLGLAHWYRFETWVEDQLDLIG
jgi:hypothetical protein